MKILKYTIFTIMILSTSCVMEEERAYNKEMWKYKTKNIELDYINKAIKTQNKAELQHTMLYIDSIIVNHK